MLRVPDQTNGRWGHPSRDLYIPIFYPPGGWGINIGVGKKYDPKTWSRGEKIKEKERKKEKKRG